MDSLFATLILLFTAVGTGCLVYLHFLPTGLHPLHNAVSEYGTGRFRFWYQAMCVNQAIAAFLTAAALATRVTPAPLATDVALIVFGIARLVISQAPVVVTQGEHKTVSKMHILMAALVFGSIVVASASFDRVIANQIGWGDTLGTLHLFIHLFKHAIALFTLLTFLAVTVARAQHCVGAVERLLYISIIGWFTTIGIHLL